VPLRVWLVRADTHSTTTGNAAELSRWWVLSGILVRDLGLKAKTGSSEAELRFASTFLLRAPKSGSNRFRSVSVFRESESESLKTTGPPLRPPGHADPTGSYLTETDPNRGREPGRPPQRRSNVRLEASASRVLGAEAAALLAHWGLTRRGAVAVRNRLHPRAGGQLHRSSRAVATEGHSGLGWRRAAEMPKPAASAKLLRVKHREALGFRAGPPPTRGPVEVASIKADRALSASRQHR